MPVWFAAGSRRKTRAVLQPGNEVAALWRGRLRRASRHDRLRAGAGACRALLDDPDRLAGLAAAAALVAGALPEREPHPDVFALVRQAGRGPRFGAPTGRRAMSRWERDLLAALGFGLDLSRCAVTGEARELAYVSPRTGPRSVATPRDCPIATSYWGCRSFLWRAGPADRRQVAQGIALTGHFLLHHVFVPQGRALPAARSRLAERMARDATMPRCYPLPHAAIAAATGLSGQDEVIDYGVTALPARSATSTSPTRSASAICPTRCRRSCRARCPMCATG